MPLDIIRHVLPVHSAMESIKQFGRETNVTINININRITIGDQSTGVQIRNIFSILVGHIVDNPYKDPSLHIIN